MGRNKKYTTDDERKAARIESARKWREEHPEYKKRYYNENKEKIAEQNKLYYEANKAALLEQQKQYYEANKAAMLERQKQYDNQYRKTPIGRANRLIGRYRQNDKKYNRGECTLTTQWIVDNIFSKSCIYCGESDWHKLGCDRINNDLPHTPDNVVCCCEECNKKRHLTDFEEFLKMR